MDVREDSVLLFNQRACSHAVEKIANDLERDYHDKEPLILAVMTGAVIFAGQLLPMLRFDCQFDYIHLTRYGDKTIGGSIEWIKSVSPEMVEGRHIILLDDVFDEGITLAAAVNEINKMNPASVKLAVMVNKHTDKKGIIIDPSTKTEKVLEADYIGFNRVSNIYLVGYGMDTVNGWHRNYPDIRYIPQ